VGFLYGTMGTITAWSTIVTLTGSHDRFISAVERDAGRVFGIEKDLGTKEQLEKVATRKGEALWSRRGVLVPLAGAGAISAFLILLGSLRTVARSGRRAWGRAAWQLGALVGLPCVAVETAVGFLHSRDLIEAVADLNDPLSQQLRSLLPARDTMVFAQAAIAVLYLVAAAAYLNTERVRRYCDEGA